MYANGLGGEEGYGEAWKPARECRRLKPLRLTTHKEPKSSRLGLDRKLSDRNVSALTSDAEACWLTDVENSGLK
jgi:hypothetical protein